MQAAGDFERKLEQVKTSSGRLSRRSSWFVTVHTLSQLLDKARKSLPVVKSYLQILICRMCWITHHDHYYLNGQYAMDYHLERYLARRPSLQNKQAHRLWQSGAWDDASFSLSAWWAGFEHLIDFWPSLDVSNELHLVSIHGVSMKGDIIEKYLAGLRGETAFCDTL